jgi:hypothetical protein
LGEKQKKIPVNTKKRPVFPDLFMKQGSKNQDRIDVVPVKKM